MTRPSRPRYSFRAATRATTELQLRWDTVVAISDALLSHHTLGRDEIWAIIENAPAHLPQLKRPVSNVDD